MMIMIMNQVLSLFQDFSLFTNMEPKKSSKLSTFKSKKPLERKVADDLVKKHILNQKLREKDIGTSFLDLF